MAFINWNWVGVELLEFPAIQLELGLNGWVPFSFSSVSLLFLPTYHSLPPIDPHSLTYHWILILNEPIGQRCLGIKHWEITIPVAEAMHLLIGRSRCPSVPFGSFMHFRFGERHDGYLWWTHPRLKSTQRYLGSAQAPKWHVGLGSCSL